MRLSIGAMPRSPIPGDAPRNHDRASIWIASGRAKSGSCSRVESCATNPLTRKDLAIGKCSRISRAACRAKTPDVFGPQALEKRSRALEQGRKCVQLQDRK